MTKNLWRVLFSVMALAAASCGEGASPPTEAVVPASTQRDFEWSVAQWIAAEESERVRVMSFWGDLAADVIEQRGATGVGDDAMPQLRLDVVACVARLADLLPEHARGERVDDLGEECAGIVADERTRQEFERLRTPVR